MIHKQADLITLNILHQGKIRRKNWNRKLVSIQPGFLLLQTFCSLGLFKLWKVVKKERSKDKVRD